MKNDKTKINENQIIIIANNCEQIGNECFKKFNENNSLESAKVAINAYRNSLYANSILIKNKKI